jgi:hypothetical protein
MHYTYYSTVCWNLIVNNQRGMNLESTVKYTVLYCNSFFNNSEQAIDDGTGNQWYDSKTLEGNYWSDYSGIGPYEIGGSAGANDPYPIYDLDGDLLPDSWEIQHGLDPMDPTDAALDKDNDGMSNIWEFINDFNASDSSDATLDKDNDGMTNLYEYQHDLLVGTDDAALDRDNDGMSNIWEFINDFNASDPSDALLDKDNDGMTNLYEYQHGLLAGTDDAALDKDNDGMPNIWEFTHGLSASNLSDANVDLDGDLIINIDEFQGGSNPRDFWSVPIFSLSLIHFVIAFLIVAMLIVISAIVTRIKVRETVITRLKTPDHATAKKLLVTGFKDYPAYVRAEKDAKEYILSGNETYRQGDHETAIQQYEIALYIFETLANLPLIAETVFILASVLKENGLLTAESQVLQRFPRTFTDDPIIEALKVMVQDLLVLNGEKTE